MRRSTVSLSGLALRQGALSRTPLARPVTAVAALPSPLNAGGALFTQRRWSSTTPTATAAGNGGCGSSSCACRAAAAANDPAASASASSGGCGNPGCGCASRAASSSAPSSAAPPSPPSAEQQAELGALQAEVSRLYELGSFESALAVSVSAVEKARELFGEEHPAYASALNNAALLHKVHRQDYAAAEQLYQRALNAYAVSVGDTHPSYLTTLSNLALVCRAQGHLDEARTHLERAVQAHRNAAAAAQAALAASPSTATAATAANAKASMPLASALLSLGGVLSEQGLFDDAIALQEEALLLSRRRFGEEHPATATALNNLALTHKNAARFESALTLCQQALAIRSRNLPPTHPDLIVSLNNLAELLRAMGQMDKAAIVQQKIIDIIEAQELENNPKAQQEAAEKQAEEETAKGQSSWRAANSSNNGKDDDDATAGRSS